jgi:hypothetical protein
VPHELKLILPGDVTLLLGKIVTLTKDVEETIALEMDVVEDDTQLFDEIVPDDVTLLLGKVVLLKNDVEEATALTKKKDDDVGETELDALTLTDTLDNTDDVKLDEAQPETLELPETEIVGVVLVDTELQTVTEGEEEPVIEGDPVTETVLELDTDELNDTDPVVVIVAETDDDDETEGDTLDVIPTDPHEELVGVTLIVELDDTDIDALVQPEDDTLPD